MQPCKGVNSCHLPAWFDKATPEEQASIELNCAIVNAHYARECARRHAHLADWIKAGD